MMESSALLSAPSHLHEKVGSFVRTPLFLRCTIYLLDFDFNLLALAVLGIYIYCAASLGHRLDLTTLTDCGYPCVRRLIDKLTASPKIMNVIRKLYDEDVYKLSGYFVSLMKKREEKGLDENEEEFFDLVTKVRDRKAGGKPL